MANIIAKIDFDKIDNRTTAARKSAKTMGVTLCSHDPKWKAGASYGRLHWQVNGYVITTGAILLVSEDDLSFSAALLDEFPDALPLRMGERDMLNACDMACVRSGSELSGARREVKALAYYDHSH